MEKVILKSMVAFVLSLDKIDVFYWKARKYAEFLSQPLNLGMFVPAKLVDGVWVVLKKPKGYEEWYFNILSYPCCVNGFVQNREYQEAKDRVLFEGFSFKWYDKEKTFLDLILDDDIWYFYYNIEGDILSNYKNFEIPKTIEDLVKYNLELTETTQKQIAL